jgi:hypothetical protein
MIKSREERAIWMKAAAVSSLVEKILKRDFGVLWFKPSQEDELRLIRLLQWRERYHIGVGWMLRQLIPYWRQRFSQYSRHKQGLGVTISTLVGKKSEEIIKCKILLEFPDEQLRKAWQSAQQQIQWAEIWDSSENKKENWDQPGKAIAEYQRKISLERTERQRCQQKLQRRRYRNNPWLE